MPCHVQLDKSFSSISFIHSIFLQHLSEKRNHLIDKIKDKNSDEIAKIVIRNEDNEPKLTIEKKEFNLHDDHDSFFSTNTQQVSIVKQTNPV